MYSLNNTKNPDPIWSDDLDSSYVPERPNIFKRFWSAITKTPARRFATAVVAGLILSALVLGLMFAMPHLMIALTMALGSAAIWVLPTAFAAQVAVFTGVITAAVTLATTFFWGVGELLGLGVAKCRANNAPHSEPYAFEPVNQQFAPSTSSTGAPDEKTPSSASEIKAKDPEDNVPPADTPPAPPESQVRNSALRFINPASTSESKPATEASADDTHPASTSPSSN